MQIKKRKVTDNPRRYVEISEYTVLMDAAKDIWWEAFLSIAYGSLLRRNEILHLTWLDIDFDNQRINISAKKGARELLAWELKNRKNHIVPMSEKTAQLLVNIQATAPGGHSYIFVTRRVLRELWSYEKMANGIQGQRWSTMLPGGLLRFVVKQMWQSALYMTFADQL